MTRPGTLPTATVTPSAAPTASESWIVALVTACVFMSVVNTTMVNVSLPEIGKSFDVSPASLGWLVTLYSLAFGVSTPFYGRLGDRHDPFRLILGGLFVNLIALVLLATFAVGWPVLPFVALSTLVGIGQAFINSPLPVMLTRTIPQRIYGVGLGLYSMLFFAGSAFGAALSTALLDAREGAERTIRPIYFGDEQYTHISDAFLPAILVIFGGLLAANAARRA